MEGVGMIQVRIDLPWLARLKLLFGGQLITYWNRGATGPRLAKVVVEDKVPESAMPSTEAIRAELKRHGLRMRDG